MIPSQRQRSFQPKPQAHFTDWMHDVNGTPNPVPTAHRELSNVTINFITPPVRCKVYQPMELRCNGVKVTPGNISAELQSFNPKTPKSHKATAKLEDSGHKVLVKFHSMGSIQLRFPVAGLWSLSVEYEGVVHTKMIEVHGQRGKYAKLQSKLAADALHGGQPLGDEGESEDSQEEPSAESSSSRATERVVTRGMSRLAARDQLNNTKSGDGRRSLLSSSSSATSSEAWSTPATRDWAANESSSAALLAVDPSLASNVGLRALNFPSYLYQGNALNATMMGVTAAGPVAPMATLTGGLPLPMQHASTLGHASPLLVYQHSTTSQYQPTATSHLQPPFPLQPLAAMGLQFDTKGDSASAASLHFDPAASFTSPTTHSASAAWYAAGLAPGNVDIYSCMATSPSAEMLALEPTPESHTFAYNDMGQYGSASHMKQHDMEINNIQPDAYYYPIPVACSDDMDQLLEDVVSPSSPSAESSTDGSSQSSAAPVVRSGYPFLSKIFPSSTSDVVSLGQECCLVGQNFISNDLEANSVWFTLQANKVRVKAPVQYSTDTTHVVTIPPLSYFGISYALEPLMAVVELYQYSLLVPCEQQFFYLSTTDQFGQTNKTKVKEDGAAPHDQQTNSGGFGGNGPQFGRTHGNGSDNNHMVDAPGGSYYSHATGESALSEKTPPPSFFFNSGVPLMNTFTVDNNVKAIQELIRLGANVNQADLWGITPLHLAIFFGRREIANLLLRCGVEKSVQTEDINGDTPLDLVIRHWDPEIRNLYDVMVSLLRGPAKLSSGEALRAPLTSSSSHPSPLPLKPSYLTMREAISSDSATTGSLPALSTDVPFKFEGDVLRVLRPQFWTELHTALQYLSKQGSESSSTEEEKNTLTLWSQVSKAKHIISADLGLDSVPSVSILAFPVVERIDLSGNNLQFLPDNWSDFKTLTSLDVSRNKLDILPSSLASHASLKTFSFSDNPLRLLPSSPVPSTRWNIPATSTKISGTEWQKTSLFNYLVEVSTGTEQLISESKVRINILGERYVDRRLLQKTLQVDFSSFVTRLRYRVPTITPSDDLAVEDITNKFASDCSFETWTAGARHSDFASQVLVTPGGIQVVVFSLLRADMAELERLQYWIQSVAARSPGSPVILVACNAGSNRESNAALLERAAALATAILPQTSFNAVEDVIYINFANGEGVDILKKRFVDLAQRHNLTSRSYPKPIAQFMQTISVLKESRWFLTRAELVQLAAQYGIDLRTEAAFASAMSQLSSLGDLLYFGNGKKTTDRLSDIVFTEPQRLCNALTNFFVRHKRLIKDGLLFLGDCDSQIVSIINGDPQPQEAAVDTAPPSSSAMDKSPTTSERHSSPSSSPESVLSGPTATAEVEGKLSELSMSPAKSSHSSSPRSKSRANSTSTPTTLLSRVRVDDRALVDILELLGEAVLIRNDCALFPRLLMENATEELWHQYWSEGLAHSFERVYQFNTASVPQMLLNSLFAQCYQDSRLEVCLHWQRGIVLRHSGERVRIMTSASSLVLKVAGELPSRLLPFIVGLVEDLISTHAPSQLAQVLIPCPALASAPTTLTRGEVLQALCDAETQLTRDRINIRLGLVAPDLCLHDLQALETEAEALLTNSGLSVEDAFDALDTSQTDLLYSSNNDKYVFAGKLRATEEVHLAYYHHPTSPKSFPSKEAFLAASAQAYLLGLAACSSEARLLNSLQHPNIVRLKAFNLASQSLATESSPLGSLATLLAATSAVTSQPFTPELKLRMMMEMARTLSWLHANRVAHGSINASSILVTSLDVNPQLVHIKLCNLHLAKRIRSSSTDLMQQDIRDLGALFGAIWADGKTDPLSSSEPLSEGSKAVSIPGTSTASTSGSASTTAQSTSTNGVLLDREIADLVAACLTAPDSTQRQIMLEEVIQHLEYLLALNNWMNSVAPAKLSSPLAPAHAYWQLDNSVRIMERNDREIASISSIARASDGKIWVASASGHIHVWNPAQGSTISSVIQTYSPDTRQSRRRINALMASGDYVWCLTDGSICVYANNGVLVKSLTHKQSLCMAKSQNTRRNPALTSSVGNAEAVDSRVYIGGAHGEISVWDSNSVECKVGQVLENRLPITAIAADSRYLWIGIGVSRRICHVVALNKQTLNEIFRFQAHDDLISSIVVVDDSHLWTSSFDGKINVWNIIAENDNKVVVHLEKSIMTHRKPVLKMAAELRASSDASASKVYAADHNGIFVWDTKLNHVIDKHLLGRHRGAIGALESIDSTSFLSASVEDGCVCLWKRCSPP